MFNVGKDVPILCEYIYIFNQLLWPWVANFPKSYLIHFNTVILGWHIVVWSLIIVRTSWSIQHWKELVSGIQRPTIWLVVWNMNFMTFHSVGNVIHILGIIIIPTDEVIFFKGVGQPPTRKCMNMCSVTYLANKHFLFIPSGWWFGTCFIFPQYIGNNHPNWPIFFKMVKTTNHTGWCPPVISWFTNP